MEKPKDCWHGNYLDLDEETMPDGSGIGWRFWPKRKGIKISPNDIRDELFDESMEGDMVAVLIRIPTEFEPDEPEYVDVYDSYQAAKILAEWEHLKLVKQNGEEVKW